MNETATLRRTALFLTIGSFSIAALMGVVALLAGGDFGEGEGKVVLTTLIVGCASVCVLCYLATGGTPYQAVGVLGGVAVVVPVTTALMLVWRDWDLAEGPSEWIWKSFGVGTVVAGTLAQISLLLAVAWARKNLGWLLWPTLALATAMALLLSSMILGEAEADELWRLLGVIAILDVLGTVVTAALAKFGRGDDTQVDDRAQLPPALEARLAERAAQLGRSRASLLAEAVERFLQTDGEPRGAE